MQTRTATLIKLGAAAVLAASAVAAAKSLTHESPAAHDSNLMKRVFQTLFPFEDKPAWNSILATFYISSVPNLILWFIPPTLEPSSLNTMIAFATGGLLGDVFLHLVPHSFFGEGHAEHGEIKTIVIEAKRNIVIGLSIFLGFAAFFVLDKTMRVLNSGHGHSHSHSHSHAHEATEPTGTSSAIAPSSSGQNLKQRKSPADVLDVKPAEPDAKKEVNQSLRLSAYLNLFGDFTHNITDGLAMAASFYVSPQLGAVSAVATFAHEIPHEIADYSILIKSGFTKQQAMASQFLTAVGAFVGTFLGIWIAETSSAAAKVALGNQVGLFGTSVMPGELVIPMTAGGFLYIASVSVIPELLEESKSGKQAIKEYAAMAFGVACMAAIAWNE